MSFSPGAVLKMLKRVCSSVEKDTSGAEEKRRGDAGTRGGGSGEEGMGEWAKARMGEERMGNRVS
ncbi:MAG TPA: hypothetical protein VKM94_26020 [Blastocatellia bacterium]|nr:hypothetical protein [Blastocatellia bacterium]